nr:hypothetical protein [Tanacetum cinerariifolium]
MGSFNGVVKYKDQLTQILHLAGVYALMVSPTLYNPCIKQFWTTLKIKTVNDDVLVQALIDGKKVVIIEASIRHDLKLNGAEGTSCLPNAVIFEELARMGYEKPSVKITFYKAFFLPQWKFFNYTILQCLSAKTTSWNKFSSTMASAIICLANNQKFNFSKYILDNLKKNLEAGVPFYMFLRFIQAFMNHQIGDMSHHKGIYVNPSLTKKVFANIKRVGTGFFRAVTPLFGTMMVQAVEEVGDLPTAVQDTPVPDAPSSSQPQRKHKPKRKERKERKETEVSPTKLHTEDHVPTASNNLLPSDEDSMQLKELMVLCTNLSNKFLDLENEVIEMKSSHKAKIAELESRVEKLEEENIVNLENMYNLDMAHEETVLSMQDVTDVDGKEVAKEMVEVITTAKIIVDEVSTACGELNAANEVPVSAAPTNITTAQESKATKTTVDITTAPKAKGTVFHDVEESTTRTASSMVQVKDKGKAKLVEKLKVLKSRKAQIAIDEEVQSRQSDDVRKYQALKRKPVSVTQARKNMMIYLKNVVGFKMEFFKGMSYEEIRSLFEEEYNKVQTLFKEGPEMDAERIKASRKRTRKEKAKKDQTAKKANGNHQMYLAFSTMLKKFDREDLEVLWKIVKDRQCTKTSKGPKGLAMVKNWKLFDSCRVHCVTLDTIQLYLLAEKMYPLTNYTLQQIFNEVRLHVDYKVEMAYDLLRLTQILHLAGVYALMVSPTLYNPCIKQFWTTLKIKTINDDVLVQVLIDGKKVVIIEASIRHDLKLNGAEGTSCLPNAVIFEELARMGYEKPSHYGICNHMRSQQSKVNFSKYILDNLKKNLEAGVPFYMFLRNRVFRAVTPLFGTMMVQAVKEVGDLPTAVHDTPVPDAPLSSQPQRKHKPRRKERKERKETKVSPTKLHTKDHVPTASNNPLPSGEDSMQLKELMVLCINLSNKFLDVENEVIEMKSSHKAKIAELESRVEKLEEENIVNLENMYNLDMAHEETVLSMQDVTDADGKEVAKEMVEVITTTKIIVDEVSTACGELNAANEEPVSAAPTNITTAQQSEATKTTVDITTTPKAKGTVFHDVEESTTRTASLMVHVKDKGKAKLVEELKVLKSRKAQIAIDEEVQSRQSDDVRKYQALKRKPVSVTQARKNMMIYLKNVVGFKMEFFKGMSYKEIRSLFEEEYNKVQTLFKEGLEMDAERIKASRKRTRKEKAEKDQTAKK